MAEIKPTRKHTHLWNDLPFEERERLMPYQIERQILHIWQVRQILERQHKATLADLDAWVSNIREELRKYDDQPQPRKDSK